jgi:hypothetical protein
MQTLQGVDLQHLHHFQGSLRAMGAMNVAETQYPSMDGGDICHNLGVLDAAGAMTRISREDAAATMNQILEKAGGIFDLDVFSIKEQYGLFGDRLR